MARDHDPRLTMSAIRARFNEPGRYRSIDAWHRFTAAAIERELSSASTTPLFRKGHIILNAGSGNTELAFQHNTIINLDISESRVSKLSNPVLGNIEGLPLANETIDTVVCVGSVINYCDAAAAISEFARVLRPSGLLIIEFESSRSAELLFQHAYGKAAAVIDTFYAGQDEVIWVYAFEYIRDLLKAAHLQITSDFPIHVLSPWALLLFRNSKAASLVAPLDRFVRKFPPLAHFASNHLILCQKHPM